MLFMSKFVAAKLFRTTADESGEFAAGTVGFTVLTASAEVANTAENSTHTANIRNSFMAQFP
jgi:hypothetical protein